MKEIEVQNKIHPRNIIAFFGLSIICLTNGIRDFYIFKTGISKMIFPDPVTYNTVVELNQSLLATTSIQNAIPNGTTMVVLGLFILAAVFIIGCTAGVLGRCD